MMKGLLRRIGLLEAQSSSPSQPSAQPVVQEPAQEIITVGLYERGGMLFICNPDDTAKARVVKIVTLPLAVYRRYHEAHSEWSKVQATLDAYPQTLRLRKKAVRKPRVSIPDLNDSPADDTSCTGVASTLGNPEE